MDTYVLGVAVVTLLLIGLIWAVDARDRAQAAVYAQQHGLV